MSSHIPAGMNLYSAAIAATVSFLDEHGHPPTIADIAMELGVGAVELGRMFPKSEQLVEAMAENAMLLLHDSCVRLVSRVAGDNPVEQFEALADAYIDWAHNYPREFRIIGSMPAGHFEGNHRLIRYESSIHEAMLKLLERAKTAGLISADEDLNMLVAIAHTYAYGVASKMLLGDLARWSPGLSDRAAAKVLLHIFIAKFMRR